MRVIVCGSRRWSDRRKIGDRLFALDPNTILVHGGARGADRIAEEEAGKCGIWTEVHLPDYERHGKKRAPLERNKLMAELGADLCIAFWDGRSTGTAHMMEEARKRGIPVEVVA